jgi:hypothetical protein
MTEMAASSPTALPVASPPAVSNPTNPIVAARQQVSGTVGPMLPSTSPCFANLYPCETFNFSLQREGPIEVTLTWDGDPGALRVQLYWEGQFLAHEDIAPRGGPSRINFIRPRMEANSYQVRVVSLAPERAIPFSLVVSY